VLASTFVTWRPAQTSFARAGLPVQMGADRLAPFDPPKSGPGDYGQAATQGGFVVAQSSITGTSMDTQRPPSQDPDVLLEHVTKRFGDVTAVDDLTIAIPRGRFFSLLGPSGCGKTTTLRMIGGFEDPSTGSIHLGGTEVTGLPAYRRDVNTVFQSYALFPHLNVYDNVAFGLRRKRRPKEEVDRRVRESLHLVDLPGFENRKPSQLSGGQQQRVALARALVNHPKVLLLDEPLGALDLKLRKQMQLELKRIQEEVGITFIYVTHDQEEAMTMSDQIAVMRHGRIEQIGAPEEIYESPASEFVAGFLGASNLLEGSVADSDGERSTVKLATGGTITVPSNRFDGQGGRVKVGVRPEKIRLADASADVPAGWNCITGTLRMATFVGVSHQFTIDGPGDRPLTVYAQNLGSETIPAPGQPVRLLWRPEHTFVVRPSTPLADWEEEQ
jgi:spermidine/putrescine transport system ATP-binding protein